MGAPREEEKYLEMAGRICPFPDDLERLRRGGDTGYVGERSFERRCRLGRPLRGPSSAGSSPDGGAVVFLIIAKQNFVPLVRESDVHAP